MLPIKTILHPTDFSEYSNRALRLACALARDYRARLIVMHAAHAPMPFYGDGALPFDQEVLNRQAQEEFNNFAIPDLGIPTERRFELGDPAVTILHLAEELPIDLIVMGTHGRTGLARLLMGSVAENVVRKAMCPVLTVKTPVSEKAPVAEAVAAQEQTPMVAFAG